MKSIEERAKEYVSKKHIDCGNCDTCVKCPDYWAYISIAKEQKAIDEAQINHDDEANYKQGYYDAAEKAWSFVYSMYQVGRDNLTPLTKDEFIKAMEEKI